MGAYMVDNHPVATRQLSVGIAGHFINRHLVWPWEIKLSVCLVGKLI